MSLWKAILVIVLINIYIPAQAYNVYKCKDKNGNIVFSQTLCADTKSEFMQVVPASGFDDPLRHKKTLTDRAKKETGYKKSNDISSGRVSKVIKSDDSSKDTNNSLCLKYKDKVRRTKADMRSGYTSEQGEYLRDRLRQEKKKLKQYCN